MPRLLRVNLTDGTFKFEDIPEDVHKRFLGGFGYIAYYLLKEVDPKVDPLSPENKLMFAPGALVGTGIPTASKTMAGAKSPLTGTIMRSSAGATIGPALKKAGIDLLIIEGAAEKPSLLIIDDDHVEIKSASKYRGMDAIEVQGHLKADFGTDFATAAIGPAGENLLRIADIDSEERQFGRGGLGAVMGSKKLKAILVRGTKEVPVAKPDMLKKLIAKRAKIIKEHPATKDDMNYGTAEFFDRMNRERGTFPSRNRQRGYRKTCVDLKEPHKCPVDPYNRAPKYTVELHPCPKCTKPCGRYIEGDDTEVGHFRVEGLEYETIYSLGGALDITHFPAVAKLHEMCDRLGMDAISAGLTIARAMEAFEKGFLKPEDLDGLELTFGNRKAALEALRKMAYREGKVGELLADGVKVAAEKLAKKLGTDEPLKFAIHVKGMEPPAYDVRGIKGMALAVAVSYRGADHLTAVVYGTELVGKRRVFENVDRTKAEGKGFEVKIHEDLMAVYDATGICKFSRHMFYLEGIPELIEAVYGRRPTNAELLAIGERIVNVARLFNVRAGFTRKDDTLPRRVMHEPIPEGPSKGMYVSEEELNRMLDEYYEARGRSKDGIPLKAKLVALDLMEFLDYGVGSEA